jgi:deazaflavin-dependent oxidoreductase (nitroreductase family)
VNKFVSALTGRGWAKSTYLLTTTGRHSGLPRTTPVIPVEFEGQRWLVSPYGDVGWVRNVRVSGVVELRQGHRTERLQATEVGPEQAGPVLCLYLDKARVTAPFFDAKGGDPVEAFVAEAAKHPVFRLSAESLRGES